MGFPFRSRLDDEPEGPVAVVQMKDIDTANVLHLDHSIRVAIPEGRDKHFLKPGDLLFRSRGRNNGVAMFRGAIAPAVLAAPMMLIRPTKIDPGYLHWFLNTPQVQAQLRSLARGTAVLMIDTDSLRTLLVPVPAEHRQRQIAEAGDLARHEQELLAAIAERRTRAMAERLMQCARTSG